MENQIVGLEVSRNSGRNKIDARESVLQAIPGWDMCHLWVHVHRHVGQIHTILIETPMEIDQIDTLEIKCQNGHLYEIRERRVPEELDLNKSSYES